MNENSGVTVITGASRGIGRAIFERLSKKGLRTVGLARSAALLREICDGLNADGADAQVLAADLGSAKKALATAEILKKQFPIIDSLILNAGMSSHLRFENSTAKTREQEFGINYFAPMALLEALLPQFKDRKKGTVVSVGSLTALVPFPGNANYAASKAALFQMLRSLRLEAAREGYDICQVLPGLTKTSMSEFMPSFLPRLTVDEVAAAVEACLKSKEAVVIPGANNRVTALLHRFFPQSLDRGVGIFMEHFCKQPKDLSQ
jgi:short-subunit dehydrogenase